MDVTIIIVNYNTLELTNACVDSIAEKTSGINYEIILVDNASTDGSKEFFENDARIKYIYSTENLGFGRANNLGYKQSTGKYIFLLNSDTLLLNNAIKEFYDMMESHADNIACMGCLLTDVNGKQIHSYGRFPTLMNTLIRRCLPFWKKIPHISAGFDYKNVKYFDNKCFIVEYVTGADLFIRRHVVEKYGLFDPDFFMYYEETEMQFRYKKHGFYSCIINTPKIIHLEGGSQKKSNRWSTKSIHGLMTCYRKMYGTFRCKVLKFLLIILTMPIALVDWRYTINIRLTYIKKILCS